MSSPHLESYEKFADFLDNLEQIKNNLGSSSANIEEQRASERCLKEI